MPQSMLKLLRNTVRDKEKPKRSTLPSPSNGWLKRLNLFNGIKEKKNTPLEFQYYLFLIIKQNNNDNYAP